MNPSFEAEISSLDLEQSKMLLEKLQEHIEILMKPVKEEQLKKTKVVWLESWLANSFGLSYEDVCELNHESEELDHESEELDHESEELDHESEELDHESEEISQERLNYNFFHDHVIKYCDAEDFKTQTGYARGKNSIYIECLNIKWLEDEHGVIINYIEGEESLYRNSYYSSEINLIEDIEVSSIEELKTLIEKHEFDEFKEKMTAFMVVKGYSSMRDYIENMNLKGHRFLERDVEFDCG